MGMVNVTLLSWINVEVERALGLVRESFARFTASPEDVAALGGCPDHLHQVTGALRMVGLNGATLVSETIEGSLAGLAGGRPSVATIGVIDKAVAQLKDFVGDLARGQADVPLRLFPIYRQLAGLKSGAAVSERDLFFPDLTIRTPPHRKPKTMAAEQLASHVAKQRAVFQRGLLAWLRKPPAGLGDMRRALNQLHKTATQMPEPQGIWWVAVGFLDALETAKDPEWLASAKALGSKIERQMRAGDRAVTEALLRDVLYAIAKCPPATQRLKDIRQLYQLDGLFPKAEVPAGVLEFDIERLEVALYDLHSRLEALKRAWVQYVTGEQKSPQPFRDLVNGFKAKAKDLGNQHLLKLLEAIALVTAKLPDPYPRTGQMLVIEMASAFLLVEHVIDNFTNPQEDLEQQIGIMGGWLLDAALGKSNGEPPAGLRPDLSERIGALHLRSQVAKEILANLQHVEQVLDAFARDGSKRETLPALYPYLRQIHGALKVIGMAKAAEAAAICEKLIADCSSETHAGTADDMDWIAEGLSSIAFMLEPCKHGREPADEAIALFFRRYEKRHAPVSADTTQRLKLVSTNTTSKKTASARPNVDPELLGVYLEEADEVLANIAAHLPKRDHEALTEIRRGFHTLKGSGRMVGLMDLGEAAWEVERLMNGWLEEKRPATPALVELIETAHKSFVGWIGGLKDNSLAGEVDARRIIELAAAAKAEKPAVPEVVVSSLNEIYLKEAAGHLTVLGDRSTDTTPAFMRAAHTLASSSRTAGFEPVADLAAVLEQWSGYAQRAEPGDGEAVSAVVGALHIMVGAIGRGEAPVPMPEVADTLRAAMARLDAHPPAVVTSVPAFAGAAEQGGREKRVMRDDIDPQLLPVFLEEAQEIVPHIGSDLRDWKVNPQDQKISDSLRRLLHTLKGSARMAGAIRLGELCHLMETRIEEALEANNFPPELFEHLQERMDRLSTDVERMSGPAPVAAEVRQVVAPAPVAPSVATAVVATPAPVAPAKPGGVPLPPLPAIAALLRVNADTLDQLINESGEVAIARSRIEAELRAVKQALADLGESITRLRTQLREVEVQADSQMQSRLSELEERNRQFDPLEFDRYTRLQELTRLMAESVSDVAAIQQGMQKNVGETDAAIAHQARISRDVQQELMRVRAVPFNNLGERLYRVVRQTARELDKKAELEIEGGSVEIDRGVLERIGAPLEHMLRNALAHGIETPEARAAAGKPETGKIVINLRQESNEIALILSDDGAGIDVEKLRAIGNERGLLPTDREPTEAEIVKLIFASGLSTADEVSELAGRGVGMDVVRNDIASINGRVDVLSTRGQGTVFTVYLPLTLAVTQAVIVRCGGTRIAVSSAMVEQVLRLKADGLESLYRKKTAEFAGNSYPLHYGQHLLGRGGAPEAQPYSSVLLLRSGVQRIALHVDELIGNAEIVVKSIGPQLSRVPGVVGATVLADGTIAPIMNLVQLAQRTFAPSATLTPEAVAVVAAPTRTVIMVVDDSLTVRKITGRLLEREGYQVITAKDGVDALERMKELMPAVMLVDIEMPRMDGFDLTRNVRADPATQKLPIIFISSRTAEKHRNQAAQVGVNAFLGKPYEEADLLKHIAELAVK